MLPTKRDIYKYYLYLNKEKVRVGDWKQNTKLCDKAEYLSKEVASIWDKTGITHKLVGREGVRRITDLIMQLRDLDRLPLKQRKEGFGKELDSLFDVSICTHAMGEACTCDEPNKIPPTWMAPLD